MLKDLGYIWLGYGAYRCQNKLPNIARMRIKEKIFEAIETIKREGTTTLLVEQDAVLAMAVSEYIYVL